MNKKNIDIVKEVFSKYLEEKKLRKTPERVALVEEIYSLNDHFNAQWLYERMKTITKYPPSKATVYNTLELLFEAKLVRKHQLENENQALYEKCYFDKQHDHIVMIDSGEVIEFCDPRIQNIKQTMEEIFGITIDSHSLYFYARKKSS